MYFFYCIESKPVLYTAFTFSKCHVSFKPSGPVQNMRFECIMLHIEHSNNVATGYNNNYVLINLTTAYNALVYVYCMNTKLIIPACVQIIVTLKYNECGSPTVTTNNKDDYISY